MKTPDYTPSTIARTLREPSADPDLAIDLERVARRLSPKERTFLAAWAKGYSTRDALKHAKMTGNHMVALREILRQLTHLLNEGSEHA